MDGGAADRAVVDAALAPSDAGRPAVDAGPARAFQGGFTEMPLGAAPYAVITDFMFGEPETTAGLFVDLDGDGVDELMDIPEFIGIGPRDRRAAVYRRAMDGAWRLDPAVTARYRWRVFAAADLDGDGFTDLAGDDFGLAVAWGSAQGPGDPTPLQPMQSGGGLVRITALYVDDLDHDGALDLFVTRSNCMIPGGPLETWLATGARRFALRPGVVPSGPAVKPYALGVARPRAGEVVLSALGGPCVMDERPRSFFREAGVDAEGYPRFEGFNPIPADPDFKPGRADPNLAYFTPMGSTWSDLDGDGRFDLLVTLDPVHTVFHGADAWPLEERTNDSGFSRVTGAEGRPLLPWTTLALDLDHDGLPEVLHSHGNDLGGWRGPRFSPTQWVTLHQNRGGTRFDEVPGALGAAIRGQWRALVAGDPDRDGDADLAVGGAGEHPRLLRNDVGPARRSLSLRLVGTASNALGAGAVVDVPAHEDVTAQRFLVGASAVPNVMQEPWVFASAGPSGRVPELRITWPSGVVQVLRDLPAGQAHRVTEPSLFTLAPSSRRQPAGDGSAFLLRVTPRREDGALDAEAPVEATLLRGTQREALPAQRVSEGWVVSIPGSMTPGSARVELRIRGTVVGVLPRVWWDAPTP